MLSKRKYKETHPWLAFSFSPRQFSAQFWARLGECVSKCDHLKNTAMSDDLRCQLDNIYLRKGAQATAAIEGNSLSEGEVGDIIEGKAKPPSEDYQPLHLQIENVVRLYNGICRKARQGPLPPLTPVDLCRFQKEALANLKIDGRVGGVRQRGVVVGGYRGAPYQDCAHLLEELCKWLREGSEFRKISEELGELGNAAATVIRATMAHIYIAWIHPFDDGNGRTARMAEFYLLIQGGIPAYAAHLLSNHCNKLRDEYYRQLANATAKKSPVEFVNFMVHGFRNELRDQLDFVYKAHEKLVWADVVSSKIQGAAAARQRRIALAEKLLNIEPCAPPELLKKIEIAALYAGSIGGNALLYNDLKQLEKEGIVRKSGGAYQASKEILTEMKPAGRMEN